jgi:hypothetical protein
VLGHGVQVQVDAVLLPADRERFMHALAASIDNAAVALDQEQRTAPSAFAHAAPLVRVLSCRYDTISDYVRSDLDEETGTLSVRLPAPLAADGATPPSALFEPLVVRDALDGAYAAWLLARFTGVEPEAVPPGERHLYLEFLARVARSRPPHGGRAAPRPRANLGPRGSPAALVGE